MKLTCSKFKKIIKKSIIEDLLHVNVRDTGEYKFIVMILNRMN